MKTALKNKMSTYIKAWRFQYQRRRPKLDGYFRAGKLWSGTLV